jgi:deoxyhypusine synthase
MWNQVVSSKDNLGEFVIGCGCWKNWQFERNFINELFKHFIYFTFSFG